MKKIRASRVEDVIKLSKDKYSTSDERDWGTKLVFGWQFTNKTPTKHCSWICITANQEDIDCLNRLHNYYGAKNTEELKGKTVRIVVDDAGMLCGFAHPTEELIWPVYGFGDTAKEECTFEEFYD